MPVVKARETNLLRHSAIVMDLRDMESQGAEILTAARKQAAEIVQAAKTQAEFEAKKIRDIAKQAGRAEGLETGLNEGRQQGHDEALAATKTTLADLATAWTSLLNDLNASLPTHLAETKTDLIKLALAIASKVTRQEALSDFRVVEANVSAALELVAAGRNVTLHVHPDDISAIETYLPDLLADLKSISTIELAPNPNITPGGCTASFGTGQVDATLETQIDRIAAELLGANNLTRITYGGAVKE